MIFWAVRLVKKGKSLATKSSQKSNDSDVDRVRGNPLVDEHLLQLSKCHLKAKLDFDHLDQSMKIEQAQKELISYLGSEYRKFDKKHSKLVMFKKIRCSLIQNPYDQVGRRMASNVREIFKEHILEDVSKFSKLVKDFKIPEDFSICGINFYSPVAIIMVGLLFRVGIYMYDMHSDIEVIKELEEYEIKFKTPSFADFFGSRKIATEKLESFFLEKFQNDGFPVLTKPCELLDLIEEVAKEVLPLYKDLVVDLANIHWNPNRNLNPRQNWKLNVTLKGEAYTSLSDKQGIYNLQPNTVNDETYWENTNGQFAIWHLPKNSSSLGSWIIGERKELGQDSGFIFSPDDVAEPQKATTWKYHDGNIWRSSQRNVIVTGNSNGTMKLYDVFELLNNLVTVYQDNVKSFSSAENIVGHLNKPSATPAFVKNMTSLMEKAKGNLDGLGWFKNFVPWINTNEYISLMDSGIKMLGGVDKLILDTPLAKVIMKSLDKKVEENLNKKWEAGQGLLTNYQTLSENIMNDFKKNTTYSPHFDPIRHDFSECQLNCRNIGSKLINLTAIKSLRKATTAFYLDTHSKSFQNSSVNRISQIQAEKLDFLAISIIRSARIFLILTMIWTILHALKNTLLNYYLSRHLPLITNFQMEYKENDSKSDIF